jgi:response regulator RpfG family c-di-GMP phosphodiesterase
LTSSSIAVLIIAAATTLGLIFYVQWYLPRQLEQRFLESMKAFSKAIELRFPKNTGKTEEVIALATQLGRGFGMTRRELHELVVAAYLRDIGCCAIPYRPFNAKERSDWTEHELKVFEKHPEVSGAMLELVPSLKHIAHTVRWHHARFDGNDSIGSPPGHLLPLNARILRVASDFVWLESEVGGGVAAKTVETGAGTDYCPEVVEVLQQVLTSTRVQESQPRLA